MSYRNPEDYIQVPRELLNATLEDLHELKSEWAWRVATTEKNNRLVAELDQRICQIKALLTEGKEGEWFAKNYPDPPDDPC